jgi:hypothetical protein
MLSGTNMKERLIYRRQFLLTRETVPELNSWEKLDVGRYCLYVHPDLQITVTNDSTKTLTLLGYLFDSENYQSSNLEILQRILVVTKDFCSLICALKPYAGRYALFYQDRECLNLIQDALSLREVYYCKSENRVICGSQPNLLATFSKPKLEITPDQKILHFYQYDMKLIRSGRLWVGDETYFHNVKHLMPNHYLDIQSLMAKRYWPNRRLETIDLNTAVKQSCNYLKGVLKAVTYRYDVMMAVTSGIDSRSLLAASRDVKNRIYYFINRESRLNDKSADIQIPRNMFTKLNIPFHIHDVDGPVDEEFKKIFLNNTFMSTELILPTIYNVYFRNHGNRVNLLGVGEIGRRYYGKAPHDLDGYYLARCLKYKRSLYATAQCEKWLQEVRGIAEECNVDIMQLLLWECLLGNWGAVGNSESDIAIEEFDPYDSHYIYEIMLSVDQVQGEIFEGMFREMWPELLEHPFNPPQTARDWVVTILKRIGVFWQLKKAKYRFDRWRFYR